MVICPGSGGDGQGIAPSTVGIGTAPRGPGDAEPASHTGREVSRDVNRSPWSGLLAEQKLVAMSGHAQCVARQDRIRFLDLVGPRNAVDHPRYR